MQLGEWMLAAELPSDEDTLADPTVFPFTPEVAATLNPHRSILAKLLQAQFGNSSGLPVKSFDKLLEACPVVCYIRDRPAQGSGLDGAIDQSGLIPYTGNLTVMEQGQIANWFHLHVSGAKGTFHLWLSQAPLAHAMTLFIASRSRRSYELMDSFPRTSSKQIIEGFVMSKAWDDQMQASLDPYDSVDVDRECIAALERQMFEKSKAAGIAGYWQWGLDAGSHQNNWSPYVHTPEDWNKADAADFSEDDLLVRCNLQLTRFSLGLSNNWSPTSTGWTLFRRAQATQSKASSSKTAAKAKANPTACCFVDVFKRLLSFLLLYRYIRTLSQCILIRVNCSQVMV